MVENAGDIDVLEDSLKLNQKKLQKLIDKDKKKEKEFIMVKQKQFEFLETGAHPAAAIHGV